MLNRRTFAAACGALPLLSAVARAQALPDTARIVVGFTPGGLSDIMARRLADKLRGSYAATVMVENKPGASGQIAIGQVKDAPADGTVLLLTHSSALAMYPFTFAKLAYDPVKDLLPVSLVCHTNHAICVGPLVPAGVGNLKEFLAWAKAHPGLANTGTPGLGSMPHLIVNVVSKQSGVDLRPVAYRGTASAITDVLAGQVGSAVGPIGNFLPQLGPGKLRLVATSGDSRSSFAPSVPTFREQGIAMTAREWYGVYLPGKASSEVQARASRLVQAALGDAGLIAGLHQSGVDVAHSSPQALAGMLEADTKEWKRLTRDVGFTAES
jgi:tripartite-type tricarboxylate transporter receptor subunit TctC